jgi:glutathione peroxidase
MSFYELSAKDAKGNTVEFSQFKDKVVIVVNTASKCGFTKQFEGLEALYSEFKEQGLVILGFPCNQFMAQEPGSAEDALQFCQLKYNVDFPMMEKVDVNGNHAHAVFNYLKGNSPSEEAAGLAKLGQLVKERLLKKEDHASEGVAVKWNFTKFLVDKQGNVQRFEPMVTPEKMHESVAHAVQAMGS